MTEKDDETDRWRKLVGAAREAGATRDSADEQPAPKDFVARMQKARLDLWRFARTYLWRRWSLVAVVVAAVLYLLVYLLMKSGPLPSIAPPAPPIPNSTSNP